MLLPLCVRCNYLYTMLAIGPTVLSQIHKQFNQFLGMNDVHKKFIDSVAGAFSVRGYPILS